MMLITAVVAKKWQAPQVITAITTVMMMMMVMLMMMTMLTTVRKGIVAITIRVVLKSIYGPLLDTEHITAPHL